MSACVGGADRLAGARLGEIVQVVTGGVYQGARLAPPGHAPVDQPWVEGGAVRRPEAPLLHGPRTEALQEDVGAAHQAPEPFCATGSARSTVTSTRPRSIAASAPSRRRRVGRPDVAARCARCRRRVRPASSRRAAAGRSPPSQHAHPVQRARMRHEAERCAGPPTVSTCPRGGSTWKSSRSTRRVMDQ